jgi:hypothetical protein
MKEINLDEIRSHIERIALPYVKTALEQEYQDALANSEETRKSMKQIFSSLLRSEGVSPGDRRKLRDMIKNEKEIPILPADEKEINETAESAAKIIETSWVQFLYLALKNKKKILLNENLLPQKREDASEELWNALEMSFYPLPITFEQAKEIMRQFAKEVVLSEKAVEFSNLNLIIEALQDESGTFLVRRK